MPRHLTGTSTHVRVVSCAGVCLALLAAPISAQQAGGKAADDSGRTTRGVIILKAEPKPPPPPAPRPAPLPVPPEIVVAKCERPFAKADIGTHRYGVDMAKFDRDLARKLNGAKTQVSLDLAAPWPAQDDPPPMVGRWLEEVKASGGKVTVNEYCRKSRGFFSFFNRLFQRKAVDRLEAVRAFDAVLQIDGADQSVTQVLFRRRAPS